jgi:glycosyltransferase involved in cell wall biosynthesis
MPPKPPPKICLGMPLYNQTNLLIAALQSLLVQTYRDFRLIVVDDSTESRPGQIAKEFASKDNRMADFSIARQKNTLFVKRPWYIVLPWPIVNAIVLAWNTALRPDAGNR